MGTSTSSAPPTPSPLEGEPDAPAAGVSSFLWAGTLPKICRRVRAGWARVVGALTHLAEPHLICCMGASRALMLRQASLPCLRTARAHASSRLQPALERSAWTLLVGPCDSTSQKASLAFQSARKSVHLSSKAQTDVHITLLCGHGCLKQGTSVHACPTGTLAQSPQSRHEDIPETS